MNPPTGSAPTELAPPVMSIENLQAGYDPVRVLNVSLLHARRREVTAVVGANGAGKSTLLRAISGLATVFEGTMTLTDPDEAAGDGKHNDQGEIDLRAMSPSTRVRAGVVHVAEGRRVFHRQSVDDNLRLGLFGVGLGQTEADARIEEAIELFPALRDRLRTAAGSLSGGQQQMLALAQASVRRPRLLLVDEPSLGLAPRIVEEVFEHLDQLKQTGVAIILVEQLVEQALALADFAYVLQLGQVVACGSAPDLMDRKTLQQAYLGVAASTGQTTEGGHQ